MSKKRRTRKEKMVSHEKKHYLITQNSSGEATYSIADTSLLSSSENKTQSLPKVNYAYVINDMRKSILITSIIFFISFLLYILMQVNIVKLTYLGY